MGIPRLLGALVGDEFLRQKREEVEEEYKRLERQIPDAVQRALQVRFPGAEPKELVKKHAGLVEDAAQQLREYYQTSKHRKLLMLSRFQTGDRSSGAY